MWTCSSQLEPQRRNKSYLFRPRAIMVRNDLLR